MANPSTAHEPSMEEILASIRQIISEDGEASPPRQEREAKDELASKGSEEQAAASAAAPVAKPDAPSSRSEPPHPASPQSAAKPAQQPSAAALTPSADMRGRTGGSPAASPARPPAQPPRADDRSLLSERSDTAVSGAFNALAHTILAQNARTLEDLVGEMLRPMLREWLDDNLPSLVERLVKEEIERVSRGRR